MSHDAAYTKMLESEGGYVDHPNDRGGPTNKGITLHTLQRHRPNATVSDLQSLTVAQALDIYRAEYGAPFEFINSDASSFAHDTQDRVFSFLLNTSVNCGPNVAARHLQAAVGAAPDGIVGAVTRDKVARLLSQPDGATTLLATLVAMRCRHYATILQRDKSQLVFAAGWLNRVANDLMT